MASGAGSQQVSLPEGGGAISGLGEKFAADLQTGTGNFLVPIAVPSGRAGLTPSLSLQYSTGSGQSEFGLGWNMPVPGVSRRTAKGIPQYDDAKDVFVLSGHEDLVPTGPIGSHTTYRPRVDRTFSKIVHRVEGENATRTDWWEVRTRDGLVSVYGTPVGVEARGPSTVKHPKRDGAIFQWLLTETRDPLGNRIRYEYETDDQDDLVKARGASALRLKRIRWLDQVHDPKSDAVHAELRFDYGTTQRPDPFFDGRPGFELWTLRRCRAIELWTGRTELKIAKRWNLTYADERDATPANGASLLAEVELVGIDGEATQSLPPLRFGYSAFRPKASDLIRLEGPSLPPQPLGAPNYELVDLAGRGLPDVVEIDDQIRYWRNLGDGRFDLPRTMPEGPAGLRLSDPGVALLDATGNGRPDLVTTKAPLAGYYPLGPDGRWDRRGFVRYKQAPPIEFGEPGVRLVDLNGDGIIDAVRTGSQLECYLQEPEVGWVAGRRVPASAFEGLKHVDLSDPRFTWADMNGDGLSDLVLVHNGGIEYWPSLGNGNFGKRVVMRGAPRFPFEWDIKRLFVGDVDGDGLADLVYVEDRRVHIWTNQSGLKWSEGAVLKGTPPVADTDAIRLVDLLGTGVSGILWSAGAGPGARGSFFLDVASGRKPYLLANIDNGLGATTSIEYGTSTAECLRDEKKLATRWRTSLPIPVQVVKKVTAVDAHSKGKLTTTYAYHHGLWDGREREFRGFGRVDQQDAERFAPDQQTTEELTYSPPVESRHWFHLGDLETGTNQWGELDWANEYWAGDPECAEARDNRIRAEIKPLSVQAKRDALRACRAEMLRSELYALDGTERQSRPYKVTEAWHGLRTEQAGQAAGRSVFFPFPIGSRTAEWERGDDPRHAFAYTGGYDEFGLPTLELAVAVPRGRDPFQRQSDSIAPFLASETRRRYARPDDAATFIVDRLCEEAVDELLEDGGQRGRSVAELWKQVSQGAVLPFARRHQARTRTYYDEGKEKFEGLPLGKVGKHGLVTRSEALVMTAEQLRAAYGAEEPGLLAGSPGPEYPKDWLESLPKELGYSAGEKLGDRWVTAQRVRRNARGFVVEELDPVGRRSLIEYDAEEVFPHRLTDPAGLTIEAEHDYRTMQPIRVIDPNRNFKQVRYGPLGLVDAAWVGGKPGEEVGDTAESPTVTFAYDLLAFVQRQAPISVQVRKRIWHTHDALAPVTQRDDVMEEWQYSDGFGRVLQVRGRASPKRYGSDTFGDAGLPEDQRLNADAVAVEEKPGEVFVRVSGATRYDNKGRVVEQFEPAFSEGWGYRPLAMLGAKVRMQYDAVGRVERTIRPDDAFEWVLYGMVDEPTQPEQFKPSVWARFVYGANDNAGRSWRAVARAVPGADQVPEDQRNTPVSEHFDALGRAVRTVRRPSIDDRTWVEVRVDYDLRGNVLTVWDELSRPSQRTVYDLRNEPLRQVSLDAGTSTRVLDATGVAVEVRGPTGAMALTQLDDTGRPVGMWARDSTNDPVTRRERIEYGDRVLSTAEALERNLLGRPVRHYDGAGVVEPGWFDFEGTLRESTRWVISDEALRNDLDRTIEWSTDDRSLLDQTPFTTKQRVDALGRPAEDVSAEAVDGKPRTTTYIYDPGGVLVTLRVNDEIVHADAAMDAQGRPVLEYLGNGVLVRWRYDQRTQRLVRTRAERAVREGTTFVGSPVGDATRDTAYAFDPTGNILQTNEHSPGAGVGVDGRSHELTRRFTYDGLDRLRTATGRETKRPLPTLWDPAPKTDVTATRDYTEEYAFDQAGNLVDLRHRWTDGAWVRRLEVTAENNRLRKIVSGGLELPYEHDEAGRITQEDTSRRFRWNHAGQLVGFERGPEGGEAPLRARYLFDAAGQRVKKVVLRTGGFDSTTDAGGLSRHLRERGSDSWRNDTHTAGRRRERIGEPLKGDESPATTWTLSDQVHSATVTLGPDGEWTRVEEYSPLGETTFGGFAFKRYRFNGKERDEESGLYHYGLRSYAPWAARWVSPDPLGPVDGPNLYAFVHGNPISGYDATGGEDTGDPHETGSAAPAASNAAETKASLEGSSEMDNSGSKPGFMDRGGRNLLIGAASLALGLLTFSNPIGWVAFGGALAITGGVVGVGGGGIQLALSYSGAISEKETAAVDMGLSTTMGLTSVGGFTGGMAGALALEDPLEGLQIGSTVGGLAEGGVAVARGIGAAALREVRFGRGSLPAFWRGQVWESWTMSARNFQLRAAFNVPRVLAEATGKLFRMEFSHFIPESAARGNVLLRSLLNRPWNLKPLTGFGHAAADPDAFRFLEAGEKSLVAPFVQSGFAKWSVRTPDWMQEVGQGFAGALRLAGPGTESTEAEQ